MKICNGNQVDMPLVYGVYRKIIRAKAMYAGRKITTSDGNTIAILAAILVHGRFNEILALVKQKVLFTGEAAFTNRRQINLKPTTPENMKHRIREAFITLNANMIQNVVSSLVYRLYHCINVNRLPFTLVEISC
ncbi:hypothetical protein M0802_000813 [Mischocyttarus mexicanus]|nr:hypothetical protein M0802_000813 [Mischocyttarus mexicanus]